MRALAFSFLFLFCQLVWSEVHSDPNALSRESTVRADCFSKLTRNDISQLNTILEKKLEIAKAIDLIKKRLAERELSESIMSLSRETMVALLAFDYGFKDMNLIGEIERACIKGEKEFASCEEKANHYRTPVSGLLLNCFSGKASIEQYDRAVFGVARHTLPKLDVNGLPLFSPITKARLADQLNQEAAKLTPEEKGALDHWQSAAYTPINQYLYTGKIEPDISKYYTEKMIMEFIPKLDRILDKSIIKSRVTVFRGAVIAPQDLVKGKVITIPGYQSTSIDPAVALRWMKNAVQIIELPAGSKGLYLPANGFNNSEEQEVLLHRNVKMEVLDFREFESGKYLVHMRVVGR